MPKFFIDLRYFSSLVDSIDKPIGNITHILE